MANKHFKTFETPLESAIKDGKLPYRVGMECTWCRRRMDPPFTTTRMRATRDHLHPKRLRTKHQEAEKVWSCFTCNNFKADLNLAAWYVRMKRNPGWWEEVELSQMNLQEALEQAKEPSTSVNLKLIKGGYDDGLLPPNNWLIHLDAGTSFSVKDKQDTANFMALQLTVHNKSEDNLTVILIENFTGKLFGRVVPDRFERRFALIEVYPKEEEQENGNSDRIQGDSGGSSGELEHSIDDERKHQDVEQKP